MFIWIILSIFSILLSDDDTHSIFIGSAFLLVQNLDKSIGLIAVGILHNLTISESAAFIILFNFSKFDVNFTATLDTHHNHLLHHEELSNIFALDSLSDNAFIISAHSWNVQYQYDARSLYAPSHNAAVTSVGLVSKELCCNSNDDFRLNLSIWSISLQSIYQLTLFNIETLSSTLISFCINNVWNTLLLLL